MRYIVCCFQGLFRKKLPDYRGAQIALELRVMLDIDSIERHSVWKDSMQ